MNFLSSRSLSPHNAFGARLTQHNYPAAGDPESNGPADARPKLKVGDRIRKCYDGHASRPDCAFVGLTDWTVRHFNPDGSVNCLCAGSWPNSPGLDIFSWVRVQ